MDAGVDTGDVVAQREVPVTPLDTGETLYRKLERACVELFSETWPLVRAGRVVRVPQRPGVGTSHRCRDVEAIDEIELDRPYTARELIDRIRARTFPPYRGVYFRHGDRRIYLRLQLLEEHQLDIADDEPLRRNQ
jgi:methionyl-tRNA formyltransferase